MIVEPTDKALCFEQVIEAHLRCPGLVHVSSNDEYDLFLDSPAYSVGCPRTNYPSLAFSKDNMLV